MRIVGIFSKDLLSLARFHAIRINYMAFTKAFSSAHLAIPLFEFEKMAVTPGCNGLFKMMSTE